MPMQNRISEQFQLLNIRISTIKNPMPAGMMKLLKAEGFANFINIMSKMISSSKNRIKMMTVQKTFKKYSSVFGYGIYSFQK